MTCQCEAHSIAISSAELVTPVARQLAETRARSKRFETLQKRTYIARNMLHAAVKDLSRLQLLIDAEQQKSRSVESTTKGLRTRFNAHEYLIDMARKVLHSSMWYGYDS